MPLSPEEVKQWVTHNGFDPEEYDADPYTTEIKPRVKAQPTMSPTTAKPEGALGAAARTAALGVLPNAAAFGPALAAGKAVGAATLPFMGPWSAIPAIGAGLVVGAGVGTAASAVQDAALSQFDKGRKFLDTTAKAAEEHPYAAVVGNVASTLPTMKVNRQMLKDAWHAVSTEGAMQSPSMLLNKLATSEAAQNVLISGGIGGAMSAVEDVSADKPVDVPKALLNTVLQGAVSDARVGVLGNVRGIGPLLKSAAYKGQPHGVLNDAQLRNVVTETTAPGVADPELVAKRQAKLEQMALDRKALEEANMFAEQGHITLDKVETAQKLANLEKRRKALQATIDKPLEPEVTTVETAGDPLKQWGRDKAAQQGVSKVEFEDTGMLTPGAGKSFGSFTPDEIRASTFAGQKGPKEAKPVTTLPEYNQTEAAFFGRSKDLQSTGDPANPPAAPEPALVASTIIHEPYHAAFDNMIRSESSSQTKMWDKLTAAVERDARFKQWQDGKFTSQPTVEEYLVRSGTRDFLADPKHAKRSWAEERRSLKRLNDGTANADDAVRIAGMKFRYDSQLAAPRAAKPPVSSTPTLTQAFERELAQRETSPQMEQTEFPKTAQEGTPLSKFLRDNSELPKNTFMPKLGQQEMRLSEPSATTSPVRPENQARVKAFLEEKKAEPDNAWAHNGTKGWSEDVGTWRNKVVAAYMGVKESTASEMIKKWKAAGKNVTEEIHNFGRTKTVSKVDKDTGQSTPEPKLDGRHFEEVRQEFIQNFRSKNPEEQANPIASGIAAEKAFDKYLEDIVYRSLNARPAAVRRGFLSTDRLSGEGVKKADAFVELIGETRRQLMNSRIQPDLVDSETGEVINGFEREVKNAANRAIKAKIDQSKRAAKIRESVKGAAEKDQSTEARRIDPTFDPEDSRTDVGIVEDKPLGEELVEPEVVGALPEPVDTEGKESALARRDYEPKYVRGAESEKLSPAQAEALNRTIADRMESASQELDSLAGKAFEAALAKHTKELQTLLYNDPKRAEEIITLLRREDPETVTLVADKFRSGKLKLSEPSATPSPVSSPDDSRLFVTSLEKELRTGKPFGLVAGKDGAISTNELRKKMAGLPAIEKELLEKSGFNEWLAVQPRVPAERVEKWLRENGPKLEVHTYGMEGKVSEAKRELHYLMHDLDTNHRGWTDDPTIEPRTSEEAPKLARVRELTLITDREPKDTSPRATAAYDGISAFDTNEPMPEWTTSREGKNVQRVDVVVPQKDTVVDNPYGGGRKMPSKEDVKWQPDNLHENLPNTLGWAMIQYKDGPNGERIAVIAEAQSRWGQEARKSKDLAKEASARGEWAAFDANGNMRSNSEATKADHPLLADTNRLILKAAIDQARKEGATHIMISDAETAMISEKLDTDGLSRVFDSEDDARDFNSSIRAKYNIPDVFGVRQDGSKWEATVDADNIHKPNRLDILDALKQEGYSLKREKGFRQNYDTSLPDIAAKITGVNGERVSLGEHKNAFYGKSRDDMNGNLAVIETNIGGKGFGEYEAGYLTRNTDTGEETFYPTLQEAKDAAFRDRPRDNLIFTNPDGTPKTDVSGQMFDISAPAARRETGEQMTMAGKQFSEPSSTPSPATPYSPDKSKQGWVERLSPQFDQVRKFSPAVADAMSNAESKRGEYEGQFLWSKVHKMQETFPDATVEDNIAALDYARAQFRKEPLPYVTAEQEAMSKLWNDEVAGPFRDEQIAQGMPIETESGHRRTAKRSPWYAADMLSKEALALFTKSTETAKVEAAKNTWAKYVVDASESRGTPVTLKDAKLEINAFVDALGSGNQDASEFGALRKAQGYGLPAELRERNLTHMMHRWARRASRDLANFVYLEKDPVVGALLGKDNPLTGARYPEPAGGRLNAHEEVTDAMSFLNNTFKVAHQPRMLGFTRLVNNLIMGPMSGVRDTATVVVNALPYVDSVDGALDIFRGLVRARHEVQSSLEAGARTGRHRFDQFDTLESVDTVANIFNKAAEFMRKYSGRDIIEQGNRIWVFAAGKQLAESAVRENNMRFLDKFGAIAKTVAKDGTVTWDTNKLAKAFVDRNQGTYGGRGLPASTVEGMAAPWFSLARWSIEKANVIYQDVVKPAYIPGKDGKRNFGPLLTYTLGAYLTGEAIEELTEVLNNDKKMAIPKWEELDAADASADRYVARLINVMQLGSFGGMAGDLLKMASDVAQGDKPRGFTVPAAELIGDGIVGSTVNFFRAVRDGSDPIDATGILIQEFLKNQVQVARIANNWSDSDNVERKNRFRDLRVWKQMTGREVPSGFNETNPAVRPEERQLKRATTPEEVEELLPKILGDLQEKHKDNPWGLKKAIDRLKANSYQTFPSPTSDTPDALEYYQFLVRSVGKEEADARLEDYMQQSGFNRGKSRALGAKR